MFFTLIVLENLFQNLVNQIMKGTPLNYCQFSKVDLIHYLFRERERERESCAGDAFRKCYGQFGCSRDTVLSVSSSIHSIPKHNFKQTHSRVLD